MTASTGVDSTPQVRVPARRRLAHTPKRLLLLTHLVGGLGWLGADVVFGVLAVTGFTSDDPARVAASYTALDVFVVPLLLIFGLVTLASGLALSIGSGLGVLRYWWVVAKLVINVTLTGLVLVLLPSRLNEAADQARMIDSSLVERLGGIPTDLVFPAFVSGTFLLAAAVLGIFKPWGRVRRRSART